MLMLRFGICLLGAGVIVLSSSAAPDLFDGFTAGWRDRWAEKRLFSTPTQYDVTQDEGQSVLHASSRASNSGLVRRVSIEAPATARLTWRWKIDQALTENRQERSRAGDDFAARVIVIFEESIVPFKTRSLNYVWAAHEPAQALYGSPYSKNVGMCVLRSGNLAAGKWIAESRDLVADYRAYFGEDPPRISGVAVLVDTDNTGLKADAWFAGLTIESPVAPAMPDDALLSAVLAAHVDAGRVDYQAVRSDARLTRYLEQLASIDPEKFSSPAEQLALWLNAYNAYTLKLIVDRQPAKSITEIGTGGLALGTIFKTTAWDLRFAEIGGKKYTLNEIEHEIIRRKFKDVRAHFALNCASGSCPVLRPEAYTSAKLNRQLDDQAELFLSDPHRNHFDLVTKTAQLSSIFMWYRKDFGGDDRAVLLFAASHAPEEIRRSIESNPSLWKVEFLPYDWSLNSTPR
jgi:hypothetical protein